jgi:endonuclease YncB( thermonuclease family)
MIRPAVALAITGCLPAFPAQTADVFAGPVKASVVRVLDGDTFFALARIWPGQTVEVNIRIRGIDAPERKARCQAERRAAADAAEALRLLIDDAEVDISNIASAKYHGRVLADVAAPKGLDVARHLLEKGLVRPYAGGRRDPWC